MYKVPQIFHDKEDVKTNFVMYPSDLFSAINNLFSGNEAVVLLTWLGCRGDGSFSPNISYMLKMTGISSPENYYRIKRNLIKTKYVEEDEYGNIHIDTTQIIESWKSGVSKAKPKKSIGEP
jgi:hypothetical protein